MSEALKSLERDVITAMKAGDRTKLDVLRMLVSKVKMIAKSDKNRDVQDGDILTAALKMVKETNETRTILIDRGRDTSVEDAEIAIVSQYLPRQMDEAELRARIVEIVASAPTTGKAVRGHLMKILNTEHKGQFDPSVANTIAGELIS